MAAGTEGLGHRIPGGELPAAEEPPSEHARLVGQEGPADQPRIYLAVAVYDFVLARARHSPPGEATGGLLLGQAFRGRDGRRFLLIDGVIEAPEVEAATRSVKFPPAAWKSLWAAARARGHRRSVVGWFHARAGEPPDLSPYEAFVHQTHFGAPWQVALVVDPATGRAHFSGWSGELLGLLAGFRLHQAPADLLLTAEEVQAAGWHETAGAQAAASTEAWVRQGGERGTWSVSAVQQQVLARRRPARRNAWTQVARAIQGVTVLVLVFVAAMMARWAVERGWPWLSGGQRGGPTAPVEGAPAAVAPAGGAGPAGIPVPSARPPEPPAIPEGDGMAVLGGGPGEQPGRPPAGPSDVAAARETVPAAPAGNAALAPQPGSDTLEYTVQPGDTLWGIAQRFYGDPQRLRWLAEVNGLRDPGRILPGQSLRLPPAGDLRPAGK